MVALRILAAIKSTKKHPYFYYKYLTLKKTPGHKKAIIAIARKMLVAIYHMIRDDKDFEPIDYEQVVTRKQSQKELNLTNIIEFLGEHGVDPETIHTVETQRSQAGQAGEGTKTSKPKKAHRKSNLNPRPQRCPQNRNLQKGDGDLPSPHRRKVSLPLNLRQLQLENRLL